MSRNSGLERAKPGKVGLNADALDRLGSVLKREIGEGRLPGAVAMIARGGQIGYFKTFGKRDPAAADDMQEDAIFRIFSMTKPIVSMAIMQLVEQGRILLADPLSKYIPAFAQTKVGVVRDGNLDLVAPDRPITVQDLLRHTSGLTYDFVGGGEHPVQKLYAQANLARPDQTNADQAEALAKLPLLNQPGTTWDYSRSTDVLGRIVEVVTGKTLGAALEEQILGPLGMKDTAFSVAEKNFDRIAEPLATDPDTQEPVKLFNAKRVAKFESGGGGLMSTAPDYARFCAMLAGGGALGKERIVGPLTLEFMASDHLGPQVRRGSDLLPAGHGFGLGFAVRTAPGMTVVPGSEGLYYWGGIAGTTFWIDPQEDLFAMLMIQAPGQRDYYRMLFRTLVYAAVE
ncbi:MAG: serine hydrolase domain-containing protein [Rhodoblastus sp.]